MLQLYVFTSGVVRPPGFEPGSSAWQADVLAKLDYGRPRQSNFSNTLKSIPTKTEENVINTLIALKSNGKSEETIKSISYKLRQLARECDLNNPDGVKYYIANATNHRTKQPLNNATKHKFAVAYDHYCKIIGIQWTKPIYKVAEITPLIPTTENVNAIINRARVPYNADTPNRTTTTIYSLHLTTIQNHIKSLLKYRANIHLIKALNSLTNTITTNFTAYHQRNN